MIELSVIGLGKLGLPLSVAWAQAGFDVIGVDIQQSVVDAVNGGQPHFYERGLEKDLQSVIGKNFEATRRIERAIQETNITFVIVATPSNDDGSFSNEYVLQVCEELAYELQHKDDYHLIVISSTVMPGSCQGIIKETLENFSGKQCGKDFGLCYCPEFVALGDCVRGFRNPDFVLVGEYDAMSGGMLQEIYERMVQNKAPVKRMDLINAELVKIALNFSVVAKITTANFIGEICEGFSGADCDIVTDAVGADRRIGHRYFKSGTRAGGACFPRDVLSMRYLYELVGNGSNFAESVRSTNNWQDQRLLELVKTEAANFSSSVIAVLGTEFKAGTDCEIESSGTFLYSVLKSTGYNVMSYKITDHEHNVIQGWGGTIVGTFTAQTLVNMATIVIITIPHKEFYDLNFFSEHQVVIDPWRILQPSKVSGKYIPLGRG